MIREGTTFLLENSGGLQRSNFFRRQIRKELGGSRRLPLVAGKSIAIRGQAPRVTGAGVQASVKAGGGSPVRWVSAVGIEEVNSDSGESLKEQDPSNNSKHQKGSQAIQQTRENMEKASGGRLGLAMFSLTAQAFCGL